MDTMITHKKRLFAGATSAALLLTLVGGCSSSGPSVEEFCTNANALIEGEAIGSVDGSDADAATKVMDDMIAQIKDTEAPDEIADDWDYVADGMTEFLNVAKKATAAQAEDGDVEAATDEMAAAAKKMSSEKMTEANDNVDAYIAENCEA